MSNDTTEWKDIPGYEGLYQVSDTGQVRRIRQSHGKPALSLLAIYHNHRGYPMVKLWNKDKGKGFAVHRLLMWAFVGYRPSEIQVNHIDGNKKNNLRANLEYVTPLENTRHAIQVLGRKGAQGTKSNTRLTDDIVREIRRLFASGLLNQRQLGEKYGLTRPGIASIVQRRCWKHI